MSAVQVTETEVFAQLETCPIPGGLYDLKMGPVERGDTCKTCGLQTDCPGHCGHIELACEVYNPFLMKQLYAMIKKCCTRCYRFRVHSSVTARYMEKFEMLGRGREISVSEIPDRMLDESKRTALDKDVGFTGGSTSSSPEHTMHWTNVSTESTWTEQFIETKTHSEQNLKHLKDTCSDAQRRAHFNLMKNLSKEPLSTVSGGMGSRVTNGEVGTWHNLVEDYYSMFPPSVCENCGQASNTFRVDGYSRIFMKPRKASKEEEKYCAPSYIHDNIAKYLWKNEGGMLKYLFPGAGEQGDQVFFLQNLVVPPNRFRPLRVGGGEGMSFLPASTQALKNVIEASEAVRNVIEVSLKRSSTEGGSTTSSRSLEELGTAVISLQDRVNTYMDSSKSGRSAYADDVKSGVRQLLERKQGLFRMKMMGKRVNFACRSVISPDINLETNQIGLPKFAAIQLSVPEPVFAHNVDYLRTLVVNGPDVYPGAVSIQFPDGKVVSLVGRSLKQRESLAKSLYIGVESGQRRIVMRHVRNGDPLLVNRQPTLHKPGIMAMLIRVLQQEKTIRMHYVNCSTFNADFDGDEINLHCPQDPVARAEALFIANADSQFLGPTGGNPLRGLIQDNVGSAALLTARNTFLTKEQTFQLLYAGLRAAMENSHAGGGSFMVEAVRLNFVKKGSLVIKDSWIELITPAVVKPVPLWTGKQVVSMLLRTLIRMCRVTGHGLNHSGKARTPGDLWGAALDGNKEEEQILIRDSELLMGVIDKNSVGSNFGGLCHVVFELLGPAPAGLLLTGVSRMVTLFIQWRGFTCCMRDLLIKRDSEKVRSDLLQKATIGGWMRLVKWAHEGRSDKNDANPSTSNIDISALSHALAAKTRRSTNKPYDLSQMEKLMLGNSSEFWGKTIDSVLPAGLQVPFPQNNFTAMVMTGAKGSKINQSQISCLLGQQELEGHRVPLMATMKSHPSFSPFDFSSRAGGFVADRFLTGVRPQEFFFHCMAGREGLIDTAVKTARSGYLQRCLVKHMECLTVQYDHTVRDSDGSIVQFLYGEDGLDVLKASYLKMPAVLKSNTHMMHGAGDLNGVSHDSSLATAYINWLRKRTSVRRSAELLAAVDRSVHLTSAEKESINLLVKRGDGDPIESVLNPMRFAGSVSNRHMAIVKDLLGNEDDENSSEGHSVASLFARKFQSAMADPGECVGTLAAQGMGEPSTQMTLNTFHLAGHGGANVTLGIPRLREIVQTASRSISTPSMFIPTSTVEQAEKLKASLAQVGLKDIVKGSTVEESVECAVSGEKVRKYILRLQLVDLDKLALVYPALSRERVESFLQNEFRNKLNRDVKNFLRVSMLMGTTSRKSRVGEEVGRRDQDEGRDEGRDDAREQQPEGEDTNETSKDSGKGRKNAAPGSRMRKTDEDLEKGDESSEDSSDGEASDAGAYDDVQEDEISGEELIKPVLGENLENPPKSSESSDDSSDESSSSDGSSSEGSSSDEERDVTSVTTKVEVDQNAIFGALGRLSSKHVFTIESRELLLCDKKVSRKILILEVVEELCNNMFVQQTVGISKVHVTNNNKGSPGITTEGCNIEFAWSLKNIDLNNLYTNDIAKMKDHYGVEACRQSIIKEIQNVFGHYGIAVDYRHLYLIADYMTHQGGYRPFNRGGINNHASPFLKMSFETSMKFLSDACHDLQGDNLKSPAAAIVIGKLVQIGTGVFDLITDGSTNVATVGANGIDKKIRNNAMTPQGKRRTKADEMIKANTDSASKRVKRFSFD